MKEHPINYWLGKKRSQTTKDKISASKKIAPFNHKKDCCCPICQAKIGNAKRGKEHPMYGRNRKNETKLIESNKDPEKRRRISKTLMNHPVSKETRIKISANQQGIPISKWLGFRKSLVYRIRHSGKYVHWRTDIFIRDNYTCQECGARNGNGEHIILHANHINPFALILWNNHVKTYKQAMSCKELWDINNGRTTCLDCHKTTDSYGGKFQRNYGRPSSII